MNIPIVYNWNIFIALALFFASAFYLFIVVSSLIYENKTKMRQDYMGVFLFAVLSSFFYGLMTIAQNETLIRYYWAIGFISGCVVYSRLVIFATNIVKFKHKAINGILKAAMYLTAIFVTALFDSIPDMIFIKDLELRYMLCNKAFLKHAGQSAGELIGKNMRAGISQKRAQIYNENDRKVIREELTVTLEENVPRGDGTTSVFETIKMPLIMDGKAIGLLGISSDITEQRDKKRKMAVQLEYANKLSDTLAEITKSATISSGDIKAAADLISRKGFEVLNVNEVCVWSWDETISVTKTIYFYNTCLPYEYQEYDKSSRPKYKAA